jgi:FKBP-type peptidyl-prolyl cis-trans isomerase FklB
MSLQDKLKAMLQSKSEEQENFLQDNATKEGVIVLPSGLQYVVLQQGDGEKPGPVTMVTVHYEGSLVNGKIFDSSYKRGQPATFGVHQVISGWTEALQLMPVGSKWRLFIPSSLGYGARGAGGSIPPNATLIFDVELLGMR